MPQRGHSSAVYSSPKLLKLDSGVGSPIVGGTCRGLLVGTAGAATLIDADGNTCTDVPLQAGYNPIQVYQITTLTSAANVWGLW